MARFINVLLFYVFSALIFRRTAKTALNIVVIKLLHINGKDDLQPVIIFIVHINKLGYFPKPFVIYNRLIFVKYIL